MILPLLPKNSVTILIVLVFQLVCFNSLSQENKSDSEINQHFSYNKNHLSFAINDIARGCYMMHYERVIQEHFGIEFGAGLTFDDWYALHYWEGPYYVKRNKPEDTRFTYSINFRLAPFQRLSFLYIAVGSWYRKFYSADKEAFFDYNGFWIGTQRIELNHKLMIGNFFTIGRHFTLDYYAGLGIQQSNNKRGYALYISQQNYYDIKLVKTYEKTVQPQFYLGLRVGISF